MKIKGSVIDLSVSQNQVLIYNKGDKIHKEIKEATLKLLESEIFIIS